MPHTYVSHYAREMIYKRVFFCGIGDANNKEVLV